MGARGFALSVVCALAAISGCYSPSVESCLYSCGNNQSCPSGLACNGQGMCAFTATTTCGNTPVDARHDAPADMFVDVTAPDTFIDTMPPAVDTAASAMFTFHSSEAGGRFECKRDNAAFASCTSPDTMSGLTNGMHTFQVRAIDAASNVDPTAALYSWQVNLGVDTIIDGHPPLLTNSGSASFQFHCINGGATIPECKLDLAGFGPCNTAGSHDLINMTEGQHTLLVRCKSPSGMDDPSPAMFMWTVDKTPPNTAFQTVPNPFHRNPMPQFVWFAEVGSTFECSMDGAAATPCLSPKTVDATAETSHTFTVLATDPAGNVEVAAASYTWTTDTTLPVTTIDSGPAMYSPSATAVFNFHASEADTTWECNLDNTGFAPCVPGASFTVAEGAHTMRIQATDHAFGVEATPVLWSWNTDLTNPTITFNAPSPTPNQTTGPQVTFSWAVSEPATQTCFFNTIPLGSCASPMTINVPHAMNQKFEVKAVDMSGRQDQRGPTWNVNCRYTTGQYGTGAIGYFHFDEPNGDGITNAYPGGAQGFLGTTGFGTTDGFEPSRVSAGRFGPSALSFTEPTRQTAKYPSGFSGNQTAITLEAWVQPNQGNAIPYGLVATNDMKGRLYQPADVGGSTVAWRVTNTSGVPFEITKSVTPAQWHHLIGIYGSGSMSFWVDGVQVGGEVAVGTATFDVSTVHFGYEGTNGFTGLLDEPLVSINAFGSNEVLAHWCPLQFP